MSKLLIKPIAGGSGESVYSSVTVTLVGTDKVTPATGFRSIGLVQDRQERILDSDPIEIELVPQALIEMPDAEETWYLVEIANRSGTKTYTIQMYDSDTALDLRDLVGAELIESGDLTVGRVLTQDERDAINATTNPPTANNPFLTLADAVAAPGGTTDHNVLSNRSLANQHPTAAITGLDAVLATKITSAQAADAAPVQSVAGRVGDVVVSKGDVGLGNVDNTSDANKPVSAATQTALYGKSDIGHGHSIANVMGLQTALDAKQEALTSGANLKTVNGESLLGSGNISISAGSSAANLSLTAKTSTSFDIASDTGTDVTVPAADATYAGLLTAAGFSKLGGIEAGAVAAGASGDLFAATHLGASDPHPPYINTTRGDARYSQVGHGHPGTYEPADATILKSAHIGVTVQGYSANLADLSGYTHTSFDTAGAASGAVSSHNTAYSHALIATAVQPAALAAGTITAASGALDLGMVRRTITEADLIAAAAGSALVAGARLSVSDAGYAGATALTAATYDFDLRRGDVLSSPTNGSLWPISAGWAYTHSADASAHHAPVTLTGESYASLSGQQITFGKIALASQVSGLLPLANLAVAPMVAWSFSEHTPTSSPVVGVVNTWHRVSVANLTGAGSFVFPTCSAGDAIAVEITATHATVGRELILTAATGATLNGVAAGTEVTRVWQVGELYICRAVATNTWRVEHDGRIMQQLRMSLTTAASGEAAGTFTVPTSASGVFTAYSEKGGFSSLSSSSAYPRRTATYEISVVANAGSTLTGGTYFQGAVYIAGALSMVASVVAPTTGSQPKAVEPPSPFYITGGTQVQYKYRSESGGKGLHASPTAHSSGFVITEKP